MDYSMSAVVAYALRFAAAGLVLYLWRANTMLSNTPPEVAKMVAPMWTDDELREAYRRAQVSSTDVRPYLKPKTGRRYVVVGGGLVGVWLVRHLIMRGEDPRAIRVLDLVPPLVDETMQGLDFVQTDISNKAAVHAAFAKPFALADANRQPMTVFHCASYISPGARTAPFLPRYQAVNVQGTANVIDAARQAGCTVLVATSSASVGLTPHPMFDLPWKHTPDRYFQVVRDSPASDVDSTRPLSEAISCYCWSKAQAERIVRAADSPSLRTGSLRPGQGIIGTGPKSGTSYTHQLLSRRYTPVWNTGLACTPINVQNCSLAHLAYEAALLSPAAASVSGKAYTITDPGPLTTYAHVYRAMTTLAARPVSFPPIPPVLMVFVCHAVDAYNALRLRCTWLHLPAPAGELGLLGMGVMQVSQLHVLYDDLRARKEIGYETPLSTLTGLCEVMAAWNQQQAAASS